jgi:hypothetical protein
VSFPAILGVVVLGVNPIGMENTMLHGNFPGGHADSFGMVLTDNTDGGKLTRMIRRMAVYNPVPHTPYYGPGYRNLPIIKIIEDPHPKDSKSSHAIQACDTVAYFLYQKFRPNAFIRRSGAQHYFDRSAMGANPKPI